MIGKTVREASGGRSRPHTAARVAALSHALGDDYVVEHWLVNYAVLVGSE